MKTEITVNKKNNKTLSVACCLLVKLFTNLFMKGIRRNKNKKGARKTNLELHKLLK